MQKIFILAVLLLSFVSAQIILNSVNGLTTGVRFLDKGNQTPCSTVGNTTSPYTVTPGQTLTLNVTDCINHGANINATSAATGFYGSVSATVPNSFTFTAVVGSGTLPSSYVAIVYYGYYQCLDITCPTCGSSTTAATTATGTGTTVTGTGTTTTSNSTTSAASTATATTTGTGTTTAPAGPTSSNAPYTFPSSSSTIACSAALFATALFVLV